MADFSETFSKYSNEHDKLINKLNLNLVFLKSIKIPIIYIYNIIDILFKNNFKNNFEKKDIILLTLVSIAFLSKENTDEINKLIPELKNKKLIRYVPVVKKSIKSIKNIGNIILKNDGLVIMNITQLLEYRYSVKLLNLIYSYLSIFEINIKDFSDSFLIDQRNKMSKELLKYVLINYY